MLGFLAALIGSHLQHRYENPLSKPFVFTVLVIIYDRSYYHHLHEVQNHTSHITLPPSQIHSTRDGSLSCAEKRDQSRESHLSFRKFREHSPRYVRLLKSSLHSVGYSFSLFHAHFNKHIADKIAHCYTLSVSMRLTTALKSLEFFPKGHAGFS